MLYDAIAHSEFWDFNVFYSSVRIALSYQMPVVKTPMILNTIPAETAAIIIMKTGLDFFGLDSVIWIYFSN
jgi:hypothetical protein